MNYFALSALLNVIANIVIGLLVYSRNRKNKQHITFALFCASVAFWSLFYILWQMAIAPGPALSACRWLMFGAVWIPVFFFHYTILLIGKESERKLTLIASYAMALFLGIGDLSTPFLVERVEPRLGFPFWPVPGPLFHVHLIMFAALVIYAAYLLMVAIQNNTGIVRTQLEYSLVATLGGFGGGMTNYFLWYGIPLRPVATISVTFYSVVIAFAILRHRFMDIRLILRDTTLHAMTATLLAAGCLVISLPLASINPHMAVVTSVLAMGLLMAFIYDPLQKALQPTIDRMMFAGRFSYLEELGQLPNDMLEFTNLREMLKFLVTRLTEAAKLERVRILMYDPGHQSYVETIAHSADAKPESQAVEPPSDLSEKSGLIELMRQNRKLLVEEDLAHLPAEQAGSVEELKALGGVACFPVMKEKELLGLVVLGRKQSGEPFNQQDLKILRALRTRLENFLGQAMVITQEALNMVKDSHDMKNDVNALKGRVTWRAMRIAGWKIDFQKQMLALELKLSDQPQASPLSVEDREHIRVAVASLRSQALEWFQEADRSRSIEDQAIQRLSHRLKNWAEYGRVVSEGFRGSRFMEAIQVGDAARNSVERWKPHAEKKGLQLSVETAPNLVVWGERSLIEQVIENLIDNALKATKQGKVDVFCRSDREGIIIEIRDTGCGIPAEDLTTIFEKPFYQGRGRESLEQSTGVGLYLVSQYARSLGGRVRAESEVGKGSSFFVHLPRYDQVSKRAAA